MRAPILSRTVSHGLSGTIATLPMTAVMFAVQRMLPSSQRSLQEPLVITEVLLRRAGVSHRLSDESRLLSALVSHFGFGATAGAAIGLARRSRTKRPALEGLAAGLCVFAASYAGWLPLARILPPPWRRSPGRTVLLVGAHAVWGTTLVTLADRRMKRSTSPR